MIMGMKLYREGHRWWNTYLVRLENVAILQNYYHISEKCVYFCLLHVLYSVWTLKSKLQNYKTFFHMSLGILLYFPNQV